MRPRYVVDRLFGLITILNRQPFNPDIHSVEPTGSHFERRDFRGSHRDYYSTVDAQAVVDWLNNRPRWRDALKDYRTDLPPPRTARIPHKLQRQSAKKEKAKRMRNDFHFLLRDDVRVVP